MTPYPRAPQAWGRIRSMARYSGVDLEAALVDGWLTRPEVDRLVASCAACGQDIPCPGWRGDWRGTASGQNGAGQEATEPAGLPACCPNKPGLEALRL